MSREVLKCDRAGCYTSHVIGDPYGIPESLVLRAIEFHEKGHKGHKVSIVNEEEV